MHFSTSTTLIALSASIVSAAPWGHQWTQNVTSSAPTSTQTPVAFPLANGFPTPSPEAVTTIEEQAGGTLSDASPPPNPGKDGLTNLQLIAFNELFEVAFFTDLLYNITNNVPGYERVDKWIVDALIAVQAQEELHTLNANDALAHFGLDPIQPCKYIFPVADVKSAIALAGTFTDLVMGTLQDVQQVFSNLNASGLVRGVGSVIGQEGEQEGFYRILQRKRPSSAPFLTTSTRDLAFTALQSFVVPGSCPNANEIPLKIFGGLNVDNAMDLQAKNGTAHFSVNTKQGTIDSSSSIVYLSGQNTPLTVPIMHFVMEEDSGIATFEASFPFEGGEAGIGAFNDGLTIAVVVSGNAEFANADALGKAVVFGPGLIEID